MYKNIKLIILIIFIDFLLAGDIDSHLRSDTSTNIMNGSKVSGIPYGYFLDSFSNSVIKGFDKKDLSAGKDKRLFIGYGVYDIKEENCKNLEIGDSSRFEVDFENIFTQSNKTYAISRTKKTFNECQALVNTYGGYIFSPNNTAIENAVAYKLGYDKEYWLGYARANCNSEYLNNEGFNSSYEHFKYKNEICDALKLNTYKAANETSWSKTSTTNGTKYCPIQINSEDYKRPYKICLPWWRVERQYRIDNADGEYEYDGKKYNLSYMQYLIDYPQRRSICTDINTTSSNLDPSKGFKSTIRHKENSTNQFEDIDVVCNISPNESIFDEEVNVEFETTCSVPTESTLYYYNDKEFDCTNTEANGNIGSARCIMKNKEFIDTCSQYYDATLSPSCMIDPEQELCKYDGCELYKKTCKKIEEIPMFKNYDYGWVKNEYGEEVRIKTHVDKRVFSYSCPPPPKPYSKCLSYSRVTVFPFHCPNPADGTESRCDELSQCLKETTISNLLPSDILSEDSNKSDSTKILNYCKRNFYCEKSYGSVDYIKRDSNGVATALGGVCEDGVTDVNAPIEIIKSEKKVCLEYEENNQTTEQTKTCTSTSISHDYTVSTSITTQDVYQENERCVRMNDLADARPGIPLVLRYETNGFFNTTIRKAFVDNSQIDEEANASNEYILENVNKKLKEVSSEIPKTSNPSTEYTQEQQFCDDTFSSQWIEQRNLLGASNESYNIKDMIGYLPSTNSTHSEEYCRSDATLNNDRCEKNVKACSGTYNLNDDRCEDASANEIPFTCGDYEYRERNTCYETKWFNKDFIGVSSNLAECENYASNLGYQNTYSHVSYNDYDFTQIGLTSTDIENKRYCILGGNKLAKNDNIFSSIAIEQDKITYKTKDNINKSLCKSYSNCIPSGIVTNYENDTESKQCILESSDDYGELEEASTVPDYIPVVVTTPTKQTGSIAIETDGYNDVVSIQEYTEGNFGYISNYRFALPKNNKVSIGGKEISPVIPHSSINYALKYDYTMKDKRQKTRNQDPEYANAKTDGLFEESSVVAGNGLVGDPLVDTIFQISQAPIAMFFGTRQRWGEFNSNYKIYNTVTADTRFSLNPYSNSEGTAYDPRIFQGNEMVLDYKNIETGTLAKSDFEKILDYAVDGKKDSLLQQGYSENTVNNLMTSDTEKAAKNYGYPSKKKYWWGTEKLYYTSKKQNNSSDSEVPIIKPLNTVFMGAVNSLAILVPYKGDYEVIAYDKHDNKLGTMVVEEQNFRTNTLSIEDSTQIQSYAKVQFALADDFNIAPNQDYELDTGSCLSSNFIEWGGGTSGAYYEQGLPDIANGGLCNKSNDSYVKEHSATRITIRATNSDIVFTIKLKKPMPYANRIVVVSMMNLADRKYTCYDEVQQCSVQ